MNENISIQALKYIYIYIHLIEQYRHFLSTYFSIYLFKLPYQCYDIWPEFCPVGWDCRIHRLHLCRGVRSPRNKCPGYDTKQSDGEVPVMLELWGMQTTPSLPLLPGPFWPGMVAPDRALIYGLNRNKLHT